MDNPFISYKVEDKSYVSLLKREIRIAVKDQGFTDKQKAEIDIIVSELTSNLIKHATHGEILYRLRRGPVFEIVSIDTGPGIEDVARMMRDGQSTTQTLGQGLGAINRLSSGFSLYSIPKWGSILYSKVCGTNSAPEKNSGFNLDIRGFFVCKPRETACGDGYRMKKTESTVQIFMADGLGHGEFAKEAVDQAKAMFDSCQETDPVDVIRIVHEGIRRTRGLVCSVATLDNSTKTWRLCGVGNISTRMYTGIMSKNYIAYNGTVGLNIPKSMKSSEFDVERNQTLIMCSDGLRTRWDLTRYPSIFRHDGTVLAAALYKDFSRGNDDSSVLIAKVI